MNSFWLNQLRKDFLWDLSYKITFFGQFAGIFITVLTFFFISETFGVSNSDYLTAYQNNYFLFSVLGIAALDLISSTIKAVAFKIREAQTFGYLDAILNSKVNNLYMFTSMMIYPFLKGFSKLLIYLLFSSFFIDINLSFEKILYLFVISIACIFPFIFLAVLSACFVLMYKQGDPVNFLTTMILSLFSGIVYPIQVLPIWMQDISNALPSTHTIDWMRFVILESEKFDFSNISLFLPALISVILVGISYTVLLRVIFYIRLNGTSNKY